MKYILVILIVALVLKDTSQLNDPYIMRGGAEFLCLLSGTAWLVSNINGDLVKKYWPVFGYFSVLIISMLFSKNIIYIMIQILSLFAVVIFAISYFERNAIRNYDQTLFVNTTVYMYFIACLLSLLIIPLLPSQAFDVLYGGEVRFRGLFSKSGMMASAAGILFGFALYGYKPKSKYFKYIAVLIGLACVALTLSRTFWLALIFASGITVYFYYPKLKKYAVMAILMSVVIVVGVMSIGVKYDTKSAEKLARVDSITSLSGRLELWETSINSLSGYRWVLGYGFTAGSEGLGIKTVMSSRETGKTTLHNGYVQSLLDSGVLGFFFYVLIIILSLKNIIKRDFLKKYAYICYTIVFLSIANIGEAVIYTASIYHSIVFWFVAIFALSLPKKRIEDSIEVPVNDNRSSSSYSSVRLRV